MQHIFRIKLKTTKTNINMIDQKLGKWAFNWTGNSIEAFSLYNYNSKNISEPFELMEHDYKLGLGFFIDSLTICSNFGVNTDIVISTIPEILIYKSPGINTLPNVSEFKKILIGKKVECNASSSDGAPKRIDERLSITLTPESLSDIEILIRKFDKCNISKTDKKLLNYWRKGVDLDLIGYTEESYLAFFKIIEYFIKTSTLKTVDIPKKYSKDKSMIAAYKFADGAKLKKLNQDHFELIKDFVDFRNHWDVAHSKTKSIPHNRYGALYYSYLEEYWDYHSHICQITRFVILSKVGIKNISLEIDGGLYKLVLL